ncbi:MAG: hypothetical protein ACSHXI_08005 [Hoeflea sp.]|uniref:hypothetical protein n=1 Tax=Hoeflea sp. TaxID=1940281 RepID=UPI003EF1DB7A
MLGIIPIPLLTRSCEIEDAQILHLQGILNELGQYLLDVHSAIELFSNSHDQLSNLLTKHDIKGAKTRSAWCRIAGRDAGIQIFHIGWHLTKSIPDALRFHQYLMEKADHTKLKAARKFFYNSFPGYAQFRHAVGHHAEINQSIKSIARNSSPIGMRCNNVDRTTIDMTIDGKHLILQMTSQTADKLTSLVKMTFDGFQNMSHSSM